MDNREDQGGLLDGLMNKAMDAIGGSSRGDDSEPRDSDLAAQARGEDAGTVRGDNTDVNMFSSGGDDTVPTSLGERAEEHAGLTGGSGDYDASMQSGDYASTSADMGAASYGTQSDYGSGMDRGGQAVGTGFGTDSGTYTAGETAGYAGESGYTEVDGPGVGQEPGFGTTGYEEGARTSGFSREPGFGSPDDADLSPQSGFADEGEGQFGGRE